MALPPRVVVVSRPTELDELLARHGTRGQAEFFQRGRGGDLVDLDRRHAALAAALVEVGAAIPAGWRRGAVTRADLDRFLFAPEDVVVVVGQDGLVANVAKYLDGQPVIGVDPEPGRNAGVLVQHPAAAVADLVRSVVAGRTAVGERAMVRCTLDDGQHLDALNEVFVGHPGHQSSRYRLQPPGGAPERHSSSGVIVGTGTGATGWCASIARERGAAARGESLPGPLDRRLAWFVREAWPSPSTGTTLTAGTLGPEQSLGIIVESDQLVVFGDGVESDHLSAGWGQVVQLGLSPRSLRLVGN